jgi:hypothetical protein
VSGLVQYLELIVEPTLDDFRKNPLSVRHAYLAAVVTYHAIDRAAYPRKSRVLLEKWRKESPEFGIVELVANQLKHVKANEGPAVPGRIPISAAIFGRMAYNTTPYRRSQYLLRGPRRDQIPTQAGRRDTTKEGADRLMRCSPGAADACQTARTVTLRPKTITL